MYDKHIIKKYVFSGKNNIFKTGQDSILILFKKLKVANEDIRLPKLYSMFSAT